MRRSASGNMLIMIIAAFIVLVAVSIVVLNLTQSISSQKTAQNACDAAALQAAKDLQRIVIDGKNGKVALVDDSPPGDNSDLKPVKGVNTLLGRLRYHSLIAYQLNNSAMQTMVQKEYQDVGSDIAQLKEVLANAANGQAYRDKNGNLINVQKNVQEIYDRNISRSAAGQREAINIQIGTFNVNGVSNVPVPTPVNMASVPAAKMEMHKGKLHYKAHTPMTTPGLPDDAIQFGLVQDEPRLIDNASFDQANNTLSPDAVQVTATQKLKALAQPSNPEKPDKQPLEGSYKVKASASFGGSLISQQMPNAKGTLVLNLPNTGFWNSFRSYGVDLTSMRSMIADSKWQGSGTWTPKNNEVASSTTNDALATTFAHFIKDLDMGTDMSSIVKAYNYNLQTAPLANAPLIDWQRIAKCLDFMPAAWAQNWNSGKNGMIPMTLVWHPPSAYIFSVQGNTIEVARTRSNAVSLPSSGADPNQPFFVNKRALVWQAGNPAKNSVTWGLAGQDKYANETDSNSNSQTQPAQTSSNSPNSKKRPRRQSGEIPTDGSAFTMTAIF